MAWRPARDRPGFSNEEIPGDLYEHVLEYETWPGFTERERLCVEFAERYADDYADLCGDQVIWTRLKSSFTDVELADLCLLCGTWDSTARMYHLLVDMDVTCGSGLSRADGRLSSE